MVGRTRPVAGLAVAGALALPMVGGVAHAATCPPGPNTGSCVVVLGTSASQPAGATTPATTGASPAVLGETITDPQAGSHSGLPFTGADVIPLVAGGGILLIGGATFVLMGARRRHAE